MDHRFFPRFRWDDLLDLDSKPLGFETRECHSEPASALRGGVSVDESTQLRHGTARVLEIALIQLYQCQPHPEVVARLQRLRPSQVVQLDGSRLGLVQRPGQERRAPKCGVHPLRFIACPLGVRICGGLEMAAGSQCLDCRITAADPDDSEVRHDAEQTIDNRFEHSRQEADGESIDSPEGADELKHTGIGPGDREKDGNQRPDQRDGSDHQAHQAQRFFGPAVGALDGGRPIDGATNGSGEFQGRKIRKTAQCRQAMPVLLG